MTDLRGKVVETLADFLLTGPDMYQMADRIMPLVEAVESDIRNCTKIVKRVQCSGVNPCMYCKERKSALDKFWKGVKE